MLLSINQNILNRNRSPRDSKSIRILALLIGLLAGNILTYLNANLYGLTDILWVIILVTILGALPLSLCLDITKFKFAEWSLYSIGLTLSLLMSLGFIVNSAGLLLHHRVLTTDVLLPILDIVGCVLIFIRSTHHNELKSWYPKLLPQVNAPQKYKPLIPLVLPFISVLGAIRLNNGGANNLALVTIVLICVYLIWFMIINTKQYEGDYVTGLFAIGLALALSISMRSNHILGSDINGEYQVFTTTIRNGLWSPSLFFQNIYNACLSITILPAFLKALMPVSAEYLFKFVMQLLMGIIPLGVYVIAARKFTNRKYLAYLAALFFIVQGQYIFEFPALIRQQVALLFFCLMLVANTSRSLTRRSQTCLVLLFGTSMVVSHYSTTYVTVALFLIAIVLTPLLEIIKKAVFKGFTVMKRTTSKQNIHWPILLILVLTAFLWYGETLNATGGLVNKLSQSITNFDSIFASDSHSDFVVSSLGFGTLSYNNQTLDEISKSNAIHNGYHPTVNQYQPTLVSTNLVSPNNGAQNLLYTFIHKIMPLFGNGLVVLGLLYIVLKSLQGDIPAYDGAIAIACGCLFFLLAVLPDISEDYNLERLYQQLLVVISPAFIYGVAVLLKKSSHRESYKKITATVVIILYFLCSSGFLDQIVFKVSNVNLANSGPNYDHFYLRDGEVDSLKWLQTNANSAQNISFDHYSVLSGRAFINIPNARFTESLLPTEVATNSYVYASSTNLKEGATYIGYKNTVITYNFPKRFFDDNKDVIFSDGDSEIYK